jgi:hypothetical protein
MAQRGKAVGEHWGPVLDKVTTEELEKPNNNDLEVLADSAVTEISRLMSELASARDYLKAEAERIKQETTRLKTLSKAAVASVQVISNNLSKWQLAGKDAA